MARTSGLCGRSFRRIRRFNSSDIMDLQQTIRQLRAEKELIELAISILEELLTTRGGDLPKRSGRKSMPLQERREVSQRMKKYWASRRKGQPD
jgi:hypothetical protein